MQKIADHYLKNNKAPGPDSFQTELIKTMPPEQLKVIQQWLNEIRNGRDSNGGHGRRYDGFSVPFA
jgi:hypothetical protein